MSGTFIVVGGPAGTGKTTIAQLLSQELKCPFLEGDEFHPSENIEKMSKGFALNDEDRWGWLTILSEKTSEACLEPTNTTKTAIVSCSMLKKIYRHHIKLHANSELNFKFIFLYSTFEELLNRVGNRKGHYMKSDMVKSQYDIMEIPVDQELIENGGDCIAIDTTGKTPNQIFQEIKNGL